MSFDNNLLYQLLSASTTVPTDKLDLLLDVAIPLKVDAGKTLMKANQKCRYFYVVKSGLLRAVLITPQGKEFVKEFYWEKDIIFGMRAMLDDQPLPYAVIAEESCQLIQIPLKVYQQLVGSNSSWKDYHIHQLETHLLYKEIKEELLLLNANEQKVQQVYRQFPALIKRVPATLIASYLGLTPVSLSRIKKRLNLS